MRTKLLLLFLFLVMQHFAEGRTRIAYQAPQAGEVWLVWGLSDWQIPKPERWPEGSYQKGNLVYSPMRSTNDGFEASLDLSDEEVIDFVFWISKSPFGLSFDRWDVNRAPQKDFHARVSGDQRIVIQPTIDLKPVSSLSVLDFNLWWLIGLNGLFLLLIWIKRSAIKQQLAQTDRSVFMLLAAFVLLLVFLVGRASIAGLSWSLYFHPRTHLLQWLAAGYDDFLFVFFLLLSFLVLSKIPRRFKIYHRVLASLFFLTVFFSLVAALLNIRVVELLGRPFNYRWLYYSDYLQSTDARAALGANLDPSLVYMLLALCLTASLLFVLLVYFFAFIMQKYRVKPMLITLLLVLSWTYYAFAKTHVRTLPCKPELIANPVSDFVRSINPFEVEPDLFTMAADSSDRGQAVFNATVSKCVLPRFRNILLIVMESTPSAYLGCYGAAYGATPELDRASENAILFDRFYAHAPATNNSMFSIVCSSYPWISYNSITKEHPDIALPGIAGELDKKGYRTAFFSAGDNRFQNAGLFLKNQGFQTIKDASSLACVGKGFEVDDTHWKFLNGKDDACAAEALVNWVSQAPKKPFFGMLWTYQTHYPYFFDGDEKQYVSTDPSFNRYLNALHHSDEQIGRILKALRQLNLADSTLVVVIGDHGEAFGQHGQTTHASAIYEENVHIPCLFINPAFSHETITAAGGLVDLAPTLLELTGTASPSVWQGKSLFTKSPHDPVYFFSPWSDYLFGCRIGDNKFIYNASRNTTAFYDLGKDPFEHLNHEPLSADAITGVHRKMAFWVQNNTRRMQSLLGE